MSAVNERDFGNLFGPEQLLVQRRFRILSNVRGKA